MAKFGTIYPNQNEKVIEKRKLTIEQMKQDKPDYIKDIVTKREELI